MHFTGTKSSPLKVFDINLTMSVGLPLFILVHSGLVKLNNYASVTDQFKQMIKDSCFEYPQHMFWLRNKVY